MSSFKWPPEGSSGGVAIYATLADFPASATTGTLAVAADTGDLYEFNGASWVLIASPGAALVLDAFDSQSPDARGANLTGGVLTMQSASGTVPGSVNLTTQTFLGQKTFSTGLTGTLTGHATLDIPLTEAGAANGVATLDSAGHIPLTQLPPSLVEYLGTWDASTNTPTLANGTGVSGQFYITSVGGTVNFGAGNITFNAGDWVLYNGSIWERAVQSNVVQSVNGQTGVVTINAINQLTGDVTAGPASGSASAASSLVATTNSTLTTLSALSLPFSQLSGQATLAQLPTIATHTLLGNNTGSSAVPSALTTAQVNAILPVFNSTLNGLAPLSGGGTTNFLRADGTWDAPVGTVGANTALSNINATALSADLIFNTFTSANVKTKDGAASPSLPITFGSGNSASSGISTGNATFQSGQSSNTGSTGNVALQSGSSAGGNTGNVLIASGTVTGGGTQGGIQLQDGSQGTAGQIWTSKDTSGTGHWTYAPVPTYQILTSGTTYTTPTGCQLIEVIVVGGGGGGGGCASSAGTAGAGGGGGGGGVAWASISSPSSSYACTIGSGGAGGTAGNNSGTAGTSSTFNTSIIGGGGAAGGGSAAQSSTVISSGYGAGGSASGGNISNIPGSNGSSGFVLGAGNSLSGFGGSSGLQQGSGGGQVFNSNPGNAGTGYGGGGSGGNQTNNGGTQAGGTASNGVIIVKEYY